MTQSGRDSPTGYTLESVVVGLPTNNYLNYPVSHLAGWSGDQPGRSAVVSLPTNNSIVHLLNDFQRALPVFTATILNWIPLLERRDFKQYILETIEYVVDDGQVIMYAFVIMPNHVHVV